MKKRINAYDCEKCHQPTVTIDVDEGVTPFTFRCKVTPGCTGVAYSRMYYLCSRLTPTIEWYKPSLKWAKRKGQDMLDHVQNGGLAWRFAAPKNGG